MNGSFVFTGLDDKKIGDHVLFVTGAAPDEEIPRPLIEGEGGVAPAGELSIFVLGEQRPLRFLCSEAQCPGVAGEFLDL